MATQIKTTELEKVEGYTDEDYVALIEPGAGAPKLVKPSALGGGSSAPVDTGSQVELNKRAIESLQEITGDLSIYDATPTGWESVADTAKMGIAFVESNILVDPRTISIDEDDITFVNQYVPFNPSNDGDGFILVKLKNDITGNVARVLDRGPYDYTQYVNSWVRLSTPTNGDSDFKYYAAMTTRNGTTELQSSKGIYAQLANSVVHAGETVFSGNLPDVENFALKSESAAKIPAARITGIVPTLKFQSLTQTAYDAITTKDTNTIYFING